MKVLSGTFLGNCFVKTYFLQKFDKKFPLSNNNFRDTFPLEEDDGRIDSWSTKITSREEK